MSLVGVVGNDNGKKPTNGHSPVPHQRIAIGKGTNDPVTVTKGGYRYAFANDAWGFYGNNRGSVRLTVTRRLEAGRLLDSRCGGCCPRGVGDGAQEHRRAGRRVHDGEGERAVGAQGHVGLRT